MKANQIRADPLSLPEVNLTFYCLIHRHLSLWADSDGERHAGVLFHRLCPNWHCGEVPFVASPQRRHYSHLCQSRVQYSYFGPISRSTSRRPTNVG
jgi:hypothetical protein